MMDVAWTKIGTLSRHHLMLVGLCAVIGYLIRARESYRLQPVWRKRAEYHHFLNKKYPTLAEELQAPVISDLDGDGISEIVLITNDLKLSVLALPESGPTDDPDDRTLPHVVIKNKTNIAESAGVSSSWPAVMTTGFVTPYMSMMQIRKQVIVIVTSNWLVLCYSSDLQLLWKHDLSKYVMKSGDYEMKSMSALVTANSVKKKSEGLVVVGGNYKHKVHLKPDKHNETSMNESREGEKTSEVTHFSTFALSAKDGSMCWHHLPGEFGENPEPLSQEHIDHHWKLNVKKHRLHVGESPWTYYKEELVKSLPHNWLRLRDTSFSIGRFQKQSFDNSGEEEERSALTAEHLIGYAYGGQRPHSDTEHIDRPNAIIIHHSQGVEVLNILTGQPITRLQLPDDGSIYGLVDKEKDIKRVSWGEQENYSPCFIEVWRVFPIKEHLERYGVCYTKRLFFTTNWVYEEDMYKKLPPLLLRSIAKKTGVVRHLLGQHLREEEAEYDVVVLGSLGRMSSFDVEGNINWQTQTTATWSDIANSVRKAKDQWTESKDEFFSSFQPDRKLFSLQVYGPKTVVAVVGWKNLAVVDLTEGRLLAEHTLPSPPTGPLVIGDFDNNGWNDIIFTCKMGYIGFSLHKESNHAYTMMYAVAVMLVILMLAWILSPEKNVADEDDDDLGDVQ